MGKYRGSNGNFFKWPAQLGVCCLQSPFMEVNPLLSMPAHEVAQSFTLVPNIGKLQILRENRRKLVSPLHFVLTCNLKIPLSPQDGVY